MAQAVAYLTVKELAERWNNALNVRTLNNWRSLGKGPTFVRFGSRVRYPLDKVQEWEAMNLQANDNKPETKESDY